jgi:hypothetical protein
MKSLLPTHHGKADELLLIVEVKQTFFNNTLAFLNSIVPFNERVTF